MLRNNPPWKTPESGRVMARVDTGGQPKVMQWTLENPAVHERHFPRHEFLSRSTHQQGSLTSYVLDLRTSHKTVERWLRPQSGL